VLSKFSEQAERNFKGDSRKEDSELRSEYNFQRESL